MRRRWVLVERAVDGRIIGRREFWTRWAAEGRRRQTLADALDLPTRAGMANPRPMWTAEVVRVGDVEVGRP